MLVIAGFYVFCYLWLNNIVVVSDMVNQISLWYPGLIWFLGNYWLTRVVRETLVVGSQVHGLRLRNSH